MDENKDKDQEDVITPEEKESEEEALSEVKEEEVKKKMAEDLGVDPEDEPELFDKLLKRELASRERLSGAIKQKINWRDKATKKIEKPKETPEDGKPPKDGEPKILSDEDIDKRLDEREAKRDLESLSLPDEVKTEIQDIAKLKGISIREAAKHPYIASKIEEVEKEERIKSAIPKGKSRGKYTPSTYDPAKPLDPANFKLDTKKGRKDWKEAKAAKRKYEEGQK